MPNGGGLREGLCAAANIEAEWVKLFAQLVHVARAAVDHDSLECATWLRDAFATIRNIRRLQYDAKRGDGHAPR